MVRRPLSQQLHNLRLYKITETFSSHLTVSWWWCGPRSIAHLNRVIHTHTHTVEHFQSALEIILNVCCAKKVHTVTKPSMVCGVTLCRKLLLPKRHPMNGKHPPHVTHSFPYTIYAQRTEPLSRLGTKESSILAFQKFWPMVWSLLGVTVLLIINCRSSALVEEAEWHPRI